MADVEIRNVTKRWGATTGIADLSLKIDEGEFVVLLGPSGCGKTRTMRMVARLEFPSEGSISIGGRDVTLSEPGERDVAMVFQSYALYPQMTVYENIRFPLRARGVRKAEQSELVRRAARMVELDTYLDRKPAALSGGQRQRVALARAIVRSPQVFLMDEPLSNLDARLRGNMRAQIKALHEKLGTTTIYVTHDQLEAMTLADRVVVMNRGRIEQIGTPREVYDRPASAFVAGFMGSPAMNLIRGEIRAQRFVAPGADLPVPGFDDTAQVLLGIRPEDLIAREGGAITGEAINVEMVGDALFVTLSVGGQNVIARLNRDADLAPHSRLSLAPTGALHVFDEASGQVIGRGQAI